MYRNRLFALTATAIVLAGCGSFTNAVSSPSATGNAPLLTRNELTQLRYVGGSNVWLTASYSGFYELFDFNTATRTASFITPPGISGESGIAYAYNPNLGGVLGYYPYQSLLHSPLAFTNSYGHSWSSVNVDVKMAGIVDPIAISNTQIYVAEGGGVIASGTPTASSFTNLPPLAQGASVRGIYGLSDGILAIVVVGGSTQLERYSEASSTWSKVGSLGDDKVAATEVVNGSSIMVGVCSQAGSTVRGQIFDGTGFAQSFTATSGGTLAGCTPEVSTSSTSLGAMVQKPTNVSLVDGSGQHSLGSGVTSSVAAGGLHLSIAPYSNGIHLIDTVNNVDYANHINATVATFVNQYQGG
jgi:hypothetical protein